MRNLGAIMYAMPAPAPMYLLSPGIITLTTDPSALAFTKGAPACMIHATLQCRLCLAARHGAEVCASHVHSQEGLPD